MSRLFDWCRLVVDELARWLQPPEPTLAPIERAEPYTNLHTQPQLPGRCEWD